MYSIHRSKYINSVIKNKVYLFTLVDDKYGLDVLQYMNQNKHSNKQVVTANAKSKTEDIIK